MADCKLCLARIINVVDLHLKHNQVLRRYDYKLT